MELKVRKGLVYKSHLYKSGLPYNVGARGEEMLKFKFRYDRSC